VEPVENRQLGDAGISENAPQSGTPVGEGSQHRVFGSSDGVEALADQDFDICIGFGNGTENLPPPLYVAACSAGNNISLSSKESGEPLASLW
jgi:hypothetical protein